MGKIQFLTDEEYEKVRKDMRTIVFDFTTDISDFESTVAKLTAYVDQQIKRYY